MLVAVVALAVLQSVETQVGNANDWVTKEQHSALAKAYSSGPVVPRAQVDRDRQTMAYAVCAMITDLTNQNATLGQRLNTVESEYA